MSQEYFEEIEYDEEGNIVEIEYDDGFDDPIADPPAEGTADDGGFVIEQGVPLAPRRTVTRKRYPFATMRHGDSFEVVVPRKRIERFGFEEAYARTRSALSAAITWHGKRRPNMRFISRRVTEDTIRCWAQEKGREIDEEVP